MSTLLRQFVDEARELIDAAAAALLLLERDPHDPGAINDLFRSVHTLKGTSALFDVPALTKLVHAAEDVLDGVRDGSLGVDGALVDVQLEVLDLVRAWIDELRLREALPANAAGASRDLVARLTACKAPPPAASAAAPEAAASEDAACDWLERFPEAERAAAFDAARADRLPVIAIEYVPDAGCYFRGDDPLMTLRSVPDLYALVIDVTPNEVPLAEFDPYDCRLRFAALSTAPRVEIDHLFRYVSDQIRIVEMTSESGARVARSERVDRIVAEQLALLGLPADDPAMLAGRIASAGRTLTCVASAANAGAAAAALAAATTAALEACDPQCLATAIGACFGEAPAALAVVPAIPAAPSEQPAAIRSAAPAADARETHAIRTLKVDQGKVDRLMALIGELVVAKNGLPFLARRAEQVHGSRELSREIGQRYAVIDRLAQEMQEAIMEVRLLPVSEVFARFPRLIRDVSRKLDKQIELVLEGEETQADKNIIELLGDPLVHIVRNAADHGIESPDVRTAKGKPAHGTIRLRATQEGDRVVIEVSDDGRGVDTARVLAKAVERGLLDAEHAERMTPAEAANLIFHPGLSTADAISDLSGRGVGMDVVQTSIRQSGGSVTVTSRPDAGTTVRLALPLSMAVMRVMTIETAGAMYGVPIEQIAETVRVETSAIRAIKQAETFLLRDTIVPLIRLRALLHLPARPQEREAVLVLRTANGLAGLVVDRFDEHIDIILKPLEGILSGLRGFAGTALLGDGRVLMVLAVKELF